MPTVPLPASLPVLALALRSNLVAQLASKERLGDVTTVAAVGLDVAFVAEGGRERRALDKGVFLDGDVLRANQEAVSDVLCNVGRRDEQYSLDLANGLVERHARRNPALSNGCNVYIGFAFQLG